ncbi:MAG: hypothetical protein ACE5KW_02490 [Dehalococcoidia bacterium]
MTDPDVVAVYVLSDPTPAERRILDQALNLAVEAVQTMAQDGLEAAMNRHNR